MRDIRLTMDPVTYSRLDKHLLRQRSRREQAAFLFCRFEEGADSARFACLDTHLIEHRQFAIHSEFHLELDDAVRAKIIKSAHDQRCSLVEIHSHPWSGPAQFSGSDFMGLAEFVPHVWWRLRGRPYAAIVATPESIDGLAWIRGAEMPERLNAVEIGTRLVSTTGLSFEEMREVRNEALR
jgi:hypothetical protein